jgi:NAD(P)-dependent dehydrogenase (short-subunit alcohol dehydrogenase family)
MKIELQNKAILVTGSNSGIGFAIASELLNAGAKVALHYNANSDGALSLQEQFPSQAKSFQCDFSNSASIPEFFDQVLSWSDGLDVLINNAGMSIMNSIDNTDEEWIHNWNTIMNINLLSAGILSKKALELFKKQSSGRIINIASRAAFRGDTPEYLAYAASKAGMVALTKSIARGFGKMVLQLFQLHQDLPEQLWLKNL